MTTVRANEVTCGVCNHVQEVHQLTSTRTSGPSDLDGRPAEPSRGTMHLWLQECTSCRYCASDITKVHRAAAARVRSPAYLEERLDERRPELASRFLCAASLAELAGNLENAGWHRVAAAWVCDDAGLEDAARAQRLTAIALLERAPVRDEKRVSRAATVVDLLRRSGELARASALATEGRGLAAAAKVRAEQELFGLFGFELELCRRGDVARHSLGEVPDETPILALPAALEVAATWEELERAPLLGQRILVAGQPWQLVGELDVLDAESERVHGLRITGASDTDRRRQKLQYPDGTVVEDLGRAHVGGSATYTVSNLRPGQPLAILRRSDYRYGDYELELWVGDRRIGVAAIVGSDQKARWRNWHVLVPASFIDSSSVEIEQVSLSIGRDVTMFRYWFYQPA